MAIGVGWGVAALACLGLEAVGVGWLVLGGHHLTHFGYWTLPLMALQAILVAVASIALWWFVSRPTETVQGGSPPARES